MTKRTRFFSQNNYALIKLGLIALSFMCISCSHLQKVHDTTKTPIIVFGHGGGFAGIEHRFLLYSDGRIFKNDLNGNMHFVIKVPKRTYDQLQSNIHQMAESMLVINDPGNTYQFLEWLEEEKKAKWLWNSSNRTNLDSDLKINHGILMHYASRAETASSQ